MRSKSYTFPVKKVGRDEWLDLTAHGVAHNFVCEAFKLKDENFTFAGGHRVRLFHFKKNIHWKAPSGTDVDISEMEVAATSPGLVTTPAPRRNQRR
jgi:hypothetical protein